MRRTVAAVTLAASTVLCARTASGQQRDGRVPTRVGIQQPPLAGVVGNAPLVFAKGKSEAEHGMEKSERKDDDDAQVVRATSSPVIRSNTAWQLRVALLPPVDPTLLVNVMAQDGRVVELAAAHPSAVIAEGARACGKCTVRLAWTFVFAAEQKGKKPVSNVVPGIEYTAAPRR